MSYHTSGCANLTLSAFLTLFSWSILQNSPLIAQTKKSSEAHRANIEYSLYATPLLVMIVPSSYGMFGLGVGAKYFLDSHAAIDVFASATTSGGGQYGSEQWSVRFQQFLGNSFHASLGVGTQNFRWDQSYGRSGYEHGEFGYNGPAAKYQARTIGAVGSIGNMWQWERFTLGAEWISLYAPIVFTKSRVERFRNEGESAARLRTAGEHKARKIVAFLPKLNIGFSF